MMIPSYSVAVRAALRVGTVVSVIEASRPLRVDDVDLASLVLARNDNHPEGDWWFDPRTGESLYYGLDDDSDLPALVAGVHVVIPREPQPETDIDDFFALAERLGVPESTAVDLYRIARRRGGARRFRERVASSDAAAAWTRFTWEREAIRAVEWLRSRDLVDADSAGEFVAQVRAATATFDAMTTGGAEA